jgi:hypothetical protein
MTAFNFQPISFVVKFLQLEHCFIITLKAINNFVPYNVKIMNYYNSPPIFSNYSCMYATHIIPSYIFGMECLSFLY